MPLLTAFSEYWEFFLEKDLAQINFSELINKKNNIIKILISSRNYPEWIFSYNFNPFFKKSYQYFLLKLELLIELLFSLDYFLEKLHNSLQLKSVYENIINILKNNKNIIDYILYFLTHEAVPKPSLLLDEDGWRILEEKLHRELPSQLILSTLLIEENYLINYCQALKDMQKILLELVDTLPGRVIATR